MNDDSSHLILPLKTFKKEAMLLFQTGFFKQKIQNQTFSALLMKRKLSDKGRKHSQLQN